MTRGSAGHLRPFFPSAADFAAAIAPHLELLVVDFGFQPPHASESGAAFHVRYENEATAVLLTWDVEGGYLACHLVPRLADGELEPDPERWLSSNEILAARGARDEWLTYGELEGADEAAFRGVLDRLAASLRDHCADVLRGDWSVYSEAHRWLEEHADE